MSNIPDHEQAARHALAYGLADGFAEVLRQWLSGAEWAEMRRRNRRNADPTICASHDFCDANMAMHESFCALIGREPAFLEGTDETGNHSAEGEADLNLMNAGWAIAANAHLTAALDEPGPRDKLTAQYDAWVGAHGYGEFTGDAEDLMLSGALTSQADSQWLSAFIEAWDAMKSAEGH